MKFGCAMASHVGNLKVSQLSVPQAIRSYLAGLPKATFINPFKKVLSKLAFSLAKSHADSRFGLSATGAPKLPIPSFNSSEQMQRATLSAAVKPAQHLKAAQVLGVVEKSTKLIKTAYPETNTGFKEEPLAFIKNLIKNSCVSDEVKVFEAIASAVKIWEGAKVSPLRLNALQNLAVDAWLARNSALSTSAPALPLKQPVSSALQSRPVALPKLEAPRASEVVSPVQSKNGVPVELLAGREITPTSGDKNRCWLRSSWGAAVNALGQQEFIAKFRALCQQGNLEFKHEMLGQIYDTVKYTAGVGCKDQPELENYQVYLSANLTRLKYPNNQLLNDHAETLLHTQQNPQSEQEFCFALLNGLGLPAVITRNRTPYIVAMPFGENLDHLKPSQWPVLDYSGSADGSSGHYQYYK